MSRDRPSLLSSDVIDQIWSSAARALGFEIQRGPDSYASSDGKGRIFIGIPEILDVDDSFAQLVFHELCHAFVEGTDRRTLPDWGLDVAGGADIEREHACLRLQAYLAQPFGLQALMAPTTEYRGYYDLIGGDPLSDAGANADAGAAIARAALATDGSSAATWILTLRQALAATASLLDGEAVEKHPLGFALGPANETCGSCAWLYVGGRGRAVERCRQKIAAAKSDSAGRTSRDFPACEKWEPPVDCQTCGACCREAYHVVSVSMRDPVVWKQPDLIVRRGHRFEILRTGARCAALNVETAPHGDTRADGDSRPGPSSRYHCRIYEDRPSTCRDFAAGGNHCLSARQRVGFSR